MTHWLAVAVAGSGIGLLMGLFGVGGSSIATPVLALLGVPALHAVASPLPATIPAALAAVVPYARSRVARPRAAAWSLVGGVPAAVTGALLSRAVGGPALLIASGVLLVVVGARVLQPVGTDAVHAGEQRRRNRALLVAATAGVGFVTGMLANGGGFLLVPLYLLVFGLSFRQAVGTSLLVIAALSGPTLATHWALGHIDWRVTGALACGLIPGATVGGRLSRRIGGTVLTRAFGWFLIGFGLLFTGYRVLAR